MPPSRLELWAGIECSVVRVGDTFVDQLVATKHEERADDLERLAALGVTAVRYPVLWERTAPGRIEDADWRFADARLGRLRELGIRPIVGLVHHGSGPRGTSLLESSFVTGLATFARAVAERYPWVVDFTPINEPLTTARFSALYGHWYPHARTNAAFVRALLVQCEATREAMRAIRSVTPAARLVQTEDAAFVFSTPRLAYQAHFENLRRFASLDLLVGRFGADHPLRAFFLENDATPEAVDSFAHEPCPPDVLGINYYVTSDRFLDERSSNYPPHTRGGNGIESYADVEAVRARPEGIVGHRRVFEDLWERYRIPLAATEVHLACTPEEQVRWLAEAWEAARDARRAGIDVRAVTAWSAFGACDWDSLLVEQRGHYEPGLFDVRSERVRPTALASVARDLATTGASEHPMLAAPGWWRSDHRLLYPPVSRSALVEVRRCLPAVPVAPAIPPVLLTGAAGTLGVALRRICEARGLPVVGLSRTELDLADPYALSRLLARVRPWAVVNAAGYVRVDQAELEPERCFHDNVAVVASLARACAWHGVRFATFSSDLVFDGAKSAPYVETDAAAPLGIYGRSKAWAEETARAILPSSLVIRTSAFFGPWDLSNFVHTTLVRLEAGQRVVAAADQIVSPTYVPDLAHAVLTLLVDGAEGLVHLANPGALSWAELARSAARAAELDASAVVDCTTSELALRAARPSFSALATERTLVLAPLEDALRRFVETRARAREAAA